MRTNLLATSSTAVIFAAALVAGAGPNTAALLAVVTAAAWVDAAEYRIPNRLVLLAAAPAAGIWVQAGAPVVAVVCAFAVLAALWTMWEAGVMGGGDVKLLPAVVLAVTSTGVQDAAVFRGVLFLTVTFAVAACFAAAGRRAHAPVAVGVPLAVWLAIS